MNEFNFFVIKIVKKYDAENEHSFQNMWDRILVKIVGLE